jgi:hypothetical protein
MGTFSQIDDVKLYFFYFLKRNKFNGLQLEEIKDGNLDAGK